MDPVTGRSRGFAFIVFSAEEVLTAILQQDHAIKGKKVAVKKAASKQVRFLLIKSAFRLSLAQKIGIPARLLIVIEESIPIPGFWWNWNRFLMILESFYTTDYSFCKRIVNR